MKRKLIACLLVVLMILPVLPMASAAQSKLVALTFDDGPGPYTEWLLDGLAERNVRATFFCLGSRAELYPDLIKRMVSDGHQVANHSYDHPNLNELSTESALAQLHRTDDILNGVIGGSESYDVRPPYGNTTQSLRSNMKAPAVIWSVDTIDWQLLNAEAVKNKILADTYDGAIVLMHDIHRTTVDAVLQAIDTLKERGYEFVTVKELCRRRGITPAPGSLLYDVRANGTDCGRLQMPEAVAEGPAEAMVISLKSPDGAPIYYTTDGSDLTYHNAKEYTDPITVRLPCTLRAVAAWDLNGDRSEELIRTYTLPPAGEPEIVLRHGRINFVPSTSEEMVYVAVGDADVYQEGEPWTAVTIPRNSWFSFYAGGDGLMPTEARHLLYTENGNLFADVQCSDWYYTALDHCASRGYIKGASEYQMDPHGTVTRGMLAELLYRYSEERIEMDGCPFTDVPLHFYYAEAVTWGYHSGILSGTGNGRFEPNRPVTRQELAKILAAYLNLDPQTSAEVYQDQKRIAPWALDSVLAVTEAGLMQGSGDLFLPLGLVDRAQIAAILMRMDQN